MSTASQFLGSSIEIGQLIQDTERGNKFTRKGQTFARTGTVYAFGSYPLAAADGGLMVNGIAATLPASVAITSWATNGAGTIVAAYGSGTNVIVSTNNGATWATAAHNNTVMSAVVWNATSSKFVLLGNDATFLYCSNSANGTTWTAQTSTAMFGGVATSNTVAAVCDGTTVLCAVKSSSTTCAATTTDGSTLTARTLAAALSGSGQINVAQMVSLGVNRWLISQNTSLQQSTAANASTWVTRTYPFSAGAAAGLCSGGSQLLLFSDSSNTYATSPDGSTWATRGFPFSASGSANDLVSPNGGNANPTAPNWLSHDGTRFITGTACNSRISGTFAYSSDGISWDSRQVTSACVASGGLAVISSNGYLVTLPVTLASLIGAQYSANWVTTCDLVGKARPILPSANTNQDSNACGALPLYVRIG